MSEMHILVKSAVLFVFWVVFSLVLKLLQVHREISEPGTVPGKFDQYESSWWVLPACCLSTSAFCPALNTPRNAYIAPETDKDDSVHIQPSGTGYRTHYSIGHEVGIQCLDGYHLEGSAMITCGMDGHWEPAVFPACYPESVSPAWMIGFWIVIAITIVLLTLVAAGIVYYMYYDCQITMPGDQVVVKQRYDGLEEEETEPKRQASKVAAIQGVTINIINNGAATATANATADATVNNGTNHTKELETDSCNNEKYYPYPVPECGDGDKLPPACRPEGCDLDECLPGSSELPEIKPKVTVPSQPHDNYSFR